MKYNSGKPFRQALEVHLKEVQQNKNIPLVRLRKQVAFERFIARLQAVQPYTWILKGGLAIQLRLGVQSRTTKDIDLIKREITGSIFDALVETALFNLATGLLLKLGRLRNLRRMILEDIVFRLSAD